VRVITRLNIGGPSIQAINLSRELHASGFHTTLIHGRLSTGEGDMLTLLPAGDTTFVRVTELVRQVAPLRDLAAIWRIYGVLCREEPDIVHTHTAKAGTLGRLAGILYNVTHRRRQPIRLVHTYHGHIFDGYFRSPITRVFLSIERFLAKRTDALVAISPRIKTDLLSTYKVAREDQIHLIPLGFDLDPLLSIDANTRHSSRASLGIPYESVVVTTVGRLTAIKRQSLFLEMAQRLENSGGRFVFLVVGDGELRHELEQLGKDLGIAQRVRFLGWRGDLPTIYAATDVFVLASRNEGTPVALIEAMAAGISCVSTDVGGVRDVIIDATCGMVVPSGDVEALTNAVASLANSAVARQQMGGRATLVVRDRFREERLVSDIKALYERLLGAGLQAQSC
jgi:glycosyltransferase involved in cell wall biosynthesis